MRFAVFCLLVLLCFEFSSVYGGKGGRRGGRRGGKRGGKQSDLAKKVRTLEKEVSKLTNGTENLQENVKELKECVDDLKESFARLIGILGTVLPPSYDCIRTECDSNANCPASYWYCKPGNTRGTCCKPVYPPV